MSKMISLVLIMGLLFCSPWVFAKGHKTHPTYHPTEMIVYVICDD